MSHRDRPAPPREAQLAADGLHAAYPSTGEVLDCVTFTVTPGTRVAILGENGSGKTTLLRCLSGAITATSGTVISAGKPLRHKRSDLTAHRQRVQLVLQDPDDQLFSADVYQDVSFGPMNLGLTEAEVRDRVQTALAMLDVTDLADRPVHHLSYGQRKRVAIAGAIAMRPRVLLLDEPTAGLDPRAVHTLMDGLATLENAGTTVALSTHDVDLAWSWADEVAVVVDKRLYQDLMVKALTDDDLIRRAHLSLPWQVRVLRGMGCHIDPDDPPRTSDDVVAAISAATRPPGR